LKKILYLFLALLVPGLIFVFLKYAGSNKFEIPVLPIPGTPLHSDCTGVVDSAYTAPDSIWRFLPNREKPAHIILFAAPGLDTANVARAIIDEIGNNVVFVRGESLSVDSALQARWKSCVFLLQSPRQSVLIDSQGRLRGHYDLRNLDEKDRLRVELKILLDK